MASGIKERVNNRNSSIELLRIICILGVIILHYNNPDYGAAFTYVKEYSVSWFLCHFLESFFIFAVDVFVIISGFFLSKNKKIDFWKPIELILRVMLYSAALYLFSVLLGKSFSIKSFIRVLIPSNYFVILYCAVYIVSPYVNIIFSKLSKDQLKIFVIILFFLFSVEPWFVYVLETLSGSSLNGLSFCGISGSQAGYDFVNFLFMYIIGAYLAKEKEIEESKKHFASYFIVLFVGVFLLLLLDLINFPGIYHYEMPVIIINSVCVFCIFKNFKINSKVINLFASGSFSVFLLHFIFMKKIKVEWACSQNVFVLFVHIILSSIIIYCICFLCHLVYDLTITRLLKTIQSKKNLELFVIED